MPIIRHPTPRREHKVRRFNRQHLALPEIRNCSFKEHSNRVESVDGRVRRERRVDVRVREISVQIFYGLRGLRDWVSVGGEEWYSRDGVEWRHDRPGEIACQ